MLLLLCVPPTHTHELAVYPATAFSDSAYVPASKLGPLLTLGPAPENELGPVAVSVKLPVVAHPLPHQVLSTTFTRVRVGALSSLVMVQVALCAQGRR